MQRLSAIARVDYNFETNKYYSLFIVGANGNYRNVVTNDNFDSLSSTTGNAYVRYINAIPDSTHPKVTITTNGTTLADVDAPFTAVSDFISTTPGEIKVAINNDSTINANRTITLEQGKVYTVLLVGIPGAADTTKTVQIKYVLNGSLTAGQ